MVFDPRSWKMHALGAQPLHEACIFRSGELSGIPRDELWSLFDQLGIRLIFDLRTGSEVAVRPDPPIPGVRIVALEPVERRRKDADKRLVAGVIGEYGVPEERMCANYRRYAGEYPLIGTALRAIAEQDAPVLVHCANGKDRTGVLCAVVQRIAGVDDREILADYLAYNELNSMRIVEEAERLGVGMTPEERAILMSFLEARPAYLHAFFEEIDARCGSFSAYVHDELRLSSAQCKALASKIAT